MLCTPPAAPRRTLLGPTPQTPSGVSVLPLWAPRRGCGCSLWPWALLLLGLCCGCCSWCYSLRAPCWRSSCCSSWCGSWRSGASGSCRRACLGWLRPCWCCGGCCSPCGRASRGCSLSWWCSPWCWFSRGRARPARSRWRVAPSCLGRGWGPAARLRGVRPGVLCPCAVCRLSCRCACGGERGALSGRFDGRFAGQILPRSLAAGLPAVIPGACRGWVTE